MNATPDQEWSLPAPSGISLAHAGRALASGDFAVARRRYERLLRESPELQPAHAGLYYACTALGDSHAAARHLGHALMLRAVVSLPFRGTGEPVSILLLQSIQAGNVLMQRLLDDRIFATHVLLVEFHRPEIPLPPHDLVFNAIGDADIRGEALAAASLLLSHTDAPVLNPPQSVAASTRSGNAHRFAGIPGIRTARTLPLPIAALLAEDACGTLAAHGFGFPLLLRAPGFHMGQNFVRVEEEGELREAAARLAESGALHPEGDLLAMEFLDGRGADGLFRKYRVLFVDGELIPLHLAIGDDWKVHYFSAEMAHSPERRSEEAHFLADMPRVLGARGMQALAALRDALALDYAGVDFGVDLAGNLLLYEANANMAVIRPGPEAIWDYRRPAIERVYASVHAMLLRRAEVAALSASSAALRRESPLPAG